MRLTYTYLSVLILCLFSLRTIDAQTPAFPGAEGFARFTTTGGRGGVVYHVTSLEDGNKEGTLRYAVAQSGARTIVFDVSGTIELQSELKIGNGNLTIAGQTAPGDGICLKNYGVTVAADNVIIRFLRFRMGVDKPDSDGTIDRDAIWGRNRKNIIIDHCSMSWCTDECASFYGNTNFTMQWCLIAESLRGSLHPKGYHGYGGIWGGQGASFHHNLVAHHSSRNPRLCGSRYTARPDLELVDIRNNVFYNWGSINSGYAGEGGSYNFINNYYKSGPATSSSIKYRIFQPSADDGSNSQEKGVYGTFYVNGNFMSGKGADWDWNGINIDNKNNSEMTVERIKAYTEYTVADVSTHSAENAFEKVLQYAGASLKRDAVDSRIVNETKSGEYTYKGSVLGGLGIIDSPADVGGWPILNSAPAQLDTDNDGMPDSWEEQFGLDKNNSSDGNELHVSGYTNLEIYLNALVEDIMKGGVASADAISEVYPAMEATPSLPIITKTGAGSSSQTIVLGSAIVSFGYSWEDGEQATVEGLPQGVDAVVDTNNKTISIFGTPTELGKFPFSVSITRGEQKATKVGEINIIDKIAYDKIYDFVVAKDGSGDFTSIQAAIDAAPANSNLPVTIFIKNGKYVEKVKLPSNKTNIHFYGQDAEKVIISWDDIGNDYNGKVGVGTMNSATFQAEGAGMYAEYVTFENSFGKGSQAVALRTASDRQCFKNCRLLSFQDTHYSHSPSSRQYFLNCFIQGATDYIFGNSTVLYDKCEFYCLNGGYYISAPATAGRSYSNDKGETIPYGLILNECTISRAGDVANNSYYFLRPWKDKGSTVLINCKSDSHIKAEGWAVWSTDPNNDASDNHLTGYFAEYNTMNLDGSPTNLSGRVSWSKVLKSEEVNNFYTQEKIFANGSDIWDPIPLTLAPQDPQKVVLDGNKLKWTVVDDAIGYVVERDDYVLTIIKDASYEDITANANTQYTYKVYAVGPNGNLSKKVLAEEGEIDTPALLPPAELIKHGAGSSSQTLKQGEEIVGFYYNWTNAETVSVKGLPNGISVIISREDSSVTFSGIADDNVGEYEYSIETIGNEQGAIKRGKIVIVGEETFLQESFKDLIEVKLSPNPITEQSSIYLSTCYSTTINLSLLDLFGHIIWVDEMDINPGSYVIPVKLPLPSGVYILKIESAEFIVCRKVMKQE